MNPKDKYSSLYLRVFGLLEVQLGPVDEDGLSFSAPLLPSSHRHIFELMVNCD